MSLKPINECTTVAELLADKSRWATEQCPQWQTVFGATYLTLGRFVSAMLGSHRTKLQDKSFCGSAQYEITPKAHWRSCDYLQRLPHLRRGLRQSSGGWYMTFPLIAIPIIVVFMFAYCFLERWDNQFNARLSFFMRRIREKLSSGRWNS
jgi:hypothetical protein